MKSLSDPVPDAADDHHLRRVLRLRPGELVCAADGAGGYRLCRWTSGRVGLEPVEDVRTAPAPSPGLAVGVSPVKGERTEWVVQKLTEIGIDEIVVFRSRRTVVRWEGDRLSRQLQRFEAVARAASAQCRRLRVPVIGVARGSDALPAGSLADPGGRAPTPDDRTVLIGPEGGWDDAEREGRELVGLGENVLRSETAALAAGVVMVGMRAGLVGPA